MVNIQERLDRTFKGLADPTRRAILAQLERRDGASISKLAEPFAIRLPAVMKHLDVLANAGLVTRSKFGRTVTVRLRAQPKREGKPDDESHAGTAHQGAAADRIRSSHDRRGNRAVVVTRGRNES
jgi:DNA-binding transcriptional ArsR family regulator